MGKIRFLTKIEFINLLQGSVVWNRLGIHSQLWEPSSFYKEELDNNCGLWYQLGWRDNQFIEVPDEYIEKKVIRDRVKVSWIKKGKGFRKALAFKKSLEQFCIDKGLFVGR